MNAMSEDSGVWPFSELPPTWAWSPFHEFAADVTSSEKKLPQKDYLKSGALPIIDQGQLFIGGYTNEGNLAFGGELPVVVFGDHTRCVKFVDVPFVQGADGVKVLSPSNALVPRFAFHALSLVRLPDKGYSRHFKFLKASKFPIAPLKEQHRIVAKLEALLARSRRAKEALDSIPDLLEKFRQSVLAAAFRGDLTADWRAQHPDVEPASKLLERIRTERRRRWEEEELERLHAKGKPPRNDAWKSQYEPPASAEGAANIPASWCYASIEELRAIEPNSLTDGPFGSNLKTSDYVSNGVRVIRLGNVKIGSLELSDEAFISPEKFAELRKHEVFAGDLVIAALAEPLARCCEIPQSLGSALVKADCIRFKPHPSIKARLVMHFLNSPLGKQAAEALGHGIGRLRINMENLRQLPVPLPPAEEQAVLLGQIEELLLRIDSVNAIVDSSKAQVAAIDEAMLAKAFCGELVPQDPNDEPASVLLERIRAERVTSAEAAPKRPRAARASSSRAGKPARAQRD